MRTTRISAVVSAVMLGWVTLAATQERPKRPLPKLNETVYSLITHLIGGPVQENKIKARKASPIAYVGKDSAPFLIMHGDKDNIVPLRQSELLADALKKVGVEVKLEVVKGSGHGGPGFNSPESRKLIEDFFAKHLGQEKQ
jgi:dipeptidyl aminopeptidase/acylaminoacyl peptidase